MKKLIGTGTLAALVLLGIGLSRHHFAPAGSAGSGVATNRVTIQNYMFSPAAINIKAGTTVTWTNRDNVSHTVTADTPSKDAPSSMDIAQGASYSFTFSKPGTYSYHCFPHPYMHGTVVVEAN